MDIQQLLASLQGGQRPLLMNPQGGGMGQIAPPMPQGPMGGMPQMPQMHAPAPQSPMAPPMQMPAPQQQQSQGPDFGNLMQMAQMHNMMKQADPLAPVSVTPNQLTGGYGGSGQGGSGMNIGSKLFGGLQSGSGMFGTGGTFLSRLFG